ncbi:MAG TPA: WbqC family protein, partial [Thermoleophilaceae bacterium]|nr:WbqC family protein [Thermoleophilaceae bacterium]
RRDWRNRNRIKTAQGVQWLTVPVITKGRYLQRIDEVRVSDMGWRQRHWRAINHAYARAPYFQRYREWLHSLYLEVDGSRLSDINRRFLQAVCEQLGITTRVSWSTEHGVEPRDPSERLAALVAAVGGREYVSGPAGRAYLRLEPFEERGLSVQFIDYTGYPEYPQAHGPFEHRVSILDLLLNVGEAAPSYMKSFEGPPALVPAMP